MKKFMSAATAAALTLSALCVPVSIVSAAEDKVQDAFGAVLQDTTIKQGETTVKIPMCFDKDVNFASISAKFSTAMFPKGGFVSEISGIESAIDDASVSATVGEKGNSVVFTKADGKDYTVKAGTPIAYINVAIKDLSGKPATDIAIGATFKVTIDELDIADANRVSYEFSSEALNRAKAVIQVVSDKVTEGTTVKIDDITAESSTVEVPVYLTGKMCVFRTELKADNGAAITGIKGEFENVETDSNSPASMAFADLSDDQTFNNTKIATATVKLPSTAKKGDKFTVTIRYFDALTMNEDYIYPSTITAGVITCGDIAASGNISDEVKGIRGDINLDGTVDARDAALITNYANGIEFDENAVEDYFKASSKHKDIVAKYGIEAVTEYALSFGDADKNGKVDARDITAVISFANEREFADDDATDDDVWKIVFPNEK